MKRKNAAWELGLTAAEKANIVNVQKARRAVRIFLEEKGFLEIDVPVIFPSKSFLYGGIPVAGQVINGYLCAVMTPFIRRWLVLAKEFDLSRVYFIGKCFRDDNVDHDHYPVFENLAIGARGEDYHFLTRLIEEMVFTVSRALGKKGVGKWQHIPYSKLGPKYRVVNTIAGNKKSLAEYNRLTAKLLRPTFVTDLPTHLFGPAKSISQHTKERSELFIKGIEIGNISSFLTDPEKLLSWYRGRGVEFDKYLIEADHLASVSTLGGEPIATGAIGLSRLYMIMLGIDTIRETVPFPYLGGD